MCHKEKQSWMKILLSHHFIIKFGKFLLVHDIPLFNCHFAEKLVKVFDVPFMKRIDVIFQLFKVSYPFSGHALPSRLIGYHEVAMKTSQTNNCESSE